MAVKSNKGVWGLLNRFEGDRVILMIVLLLIMISVLTVFSSTSLLSITTGDSRLDIMYDQLKVAGVGIVVIIVCYSIKHIGFFRMFSSIGFFASFILLAFLVLNIRTPILRAASVNDAQRVLIFAGHLQIHVYEITKVAMIMYLAWAVDALHKKTYTLAPWIADKFRFKWTQFLKTELGLKVFYIYMPILIVTLLVQRGSNSSAAFIGLVMIATIFVGGIAVKEVMKFILAGAVAVALFAGLYATGILKDNRQAQTLVSRLTNNDSQRLKIMEQAVPNSKEFNDQREALLQPTGAMLAIKQGGLKGKGPGRSTQRYIVPVMFGDYMFSFIIEEYGLWGAIIIIVLYVSLFARGAIIARNCNSAFAKTAIAGLVLLISGQGFMHMMVNVHMLPQTGQTLPMISHGSSSFLVFSLAFGILLSISRMVYLKVQKEAREAGPIMEHHDEVQASLSDLDMLETNQYDMDTDNLE